MIHQSTQDQRRKLLTEQMLIDLSSEHNESPHDGCEQSNHAHRVLHRATGLRLLRPWSSRLGRCRQRILGTLRNIGILKAHELCAVFAHDSIGGERRPYGEVGTFNGLVIDFSSLSRIIPPRDTEERGLLACGVIDRAATCLVVRISRTELKGWIQLAQCRCYWGRRVLRMAC